MKKTLFAAALLSFGMLLGGCEMMHTDHAAHANMWASVNRGVAVIYPTRGNQVSGTLYFDKAANGIHVHGTISGLAPRSAHALHVHEFGDQSSEDGSAAGSHYNPEGHQHGDVTSAQRHVGDMGNVTADDTGKATVNVTLGTATLGGMKNPLIGRGVVIHERPDDFSQPVGNAGARMGVGVIGIAKPQ